MVHASTTSSDQFCLIKAVDAPLLNWHAIPVPPVEMQPNSDVYPISSSFFVPPYSDHNVIETSVDEILNTVFPNNEINEDFEYHFVPYINCLDSNKYLDDDDFANE